MGSDSNKGRYSTPEPSKTNGNGQSFASRSTPRWRTPRNPYSSSNEGISKAVQCVVAGIFLLVMWGIINMAQLSGNIGKTVETEVAAGAKKTLNAMKKEVNQALKKDDDKYVRVPRNVYEEKLGFKVNDQKEDASQELLMDPGHRFRQKKNDKLTFEEEDLAFLGAKLLQDKMANAQQYDYHDLHKDGFYDAKDIKPEDINAEKWIDGASEKHYRTHLKTFQDGHTEEVRDMSDYDEKNPHEVPPRKHPHNNRWEDAKSLPEWMKDYFFWHNQVYTNMQEHNFTNWKQNRYLVVTCFSGKVCGNVIHRLRPMPALIKAAYDSKRILLVYWELHPLQDFLEPPKSGGCTWKVPGIMHNALFKVKEETHEDIEELAVAVMNDDKRIISATINDRLFGEFFYNGHLEHGESPADRVFHDVFNIMFKPTPMLQARVEEIHHTMGIPAGKYAAVHIDYADQPTTEEGKKVLREKVENAMNCASNLRPGGPFLVAGESLMIVKNAIEYAKKHNVMVAARQVMHDSSRLPTDIWNSFIEIYFMANANCVAYGNDGYGQLGYMMGFDHDCRIKYDYFDSAKKCTWSDTKEQAEELKKIAQEEREKAGDPKTLIFQPEDESETLWMGDKDGKDEIDPTKVFTKGFKEVNGKVTEIGMPVWLDEWISEKGQNLKKDGPWFQSETMPKWMKMYLQWGKETRAEITDENWKEYRYLIMTCYHGQPCGNVNNRLRPLAAHIRLAAANQRLLLIHWDKPNRLEYFVQPPLENKAFGEKQDIIGYDWTVPASMMWKVRQSGQQSALKVLLKQSKQLTRTIVNSQFSEDDYMDEYYNERLDTDESPVDLVFRDVFFSFFQPTIELEERIDEVMDHVGIKKGEYSVAHVPFAVEPSNDEEEKLMISHVEKSLDCLTQLNPKGPFVAFTETFAAAGAATAYGLQHGMRIPAKQIAHDKHIIPKDIMGSFVEIFLMANAKCVSYGRKGFGELGYILGLDHECKIRYTGPDSVDKCEWNGPKLMTSR